ncbi:lipid-A-disaccharide synthase [Achromobacter sp. F4_2707]|uniref:lipid-A-disaccharide synthase n=1 Tax=Achromobacter sp. F4_2707 TaxID=3114286 RepID=UPI0039C5DDA4
MALRIGMVAGEPSGDLLASRVIAGLPEFAPSAHCEGIGGPAMEKAGFDAWHPMHALTVFGYVDALKRLPGLLRIYNDVSRRWQASHPDVFVGVDAPDFNLRLEEKLKAAGVPTVHFVGPSIWAWRYERIERIRRAVSHMLVLFPFEVEIYEKEGVPVTCVGHPLAANIPMQPDRDAARKRLGLDPGVRVLAIMPGSRGSEIRQLGPRFIQAARLLQQRDPSLQFVVPMVNPERRREFERMLGGLPLSNCHIIDNKRLNNVEPDWPAAWHVMEAADAVLVASGTATLEAALFKRPMVISYVLTPLMRKIMEWKSGQLRPYVPWVGLPNVLERDFVVPELLQDEATPEALAEAAWRALADADYATTIEQRFTRMHESLALDTPRLVAEAIIKQAGGGAK